MNRQNSARYRDIMRLAAPLILTMSSMMLMQFLDALFLAWYSADAIAAVVPAGMAAWLLISAFYGTANYVSTLVAQYRGAGHEERSAAVVWQGVYFAVGAGALVALAALLGPPLFEWVGHAPAIRRLEITYFQILCLGAFIEVLAVALSGFFSGREDTRTILIVHLCGFAANALLNYALVFGKWGAPSLGMAGAAIGTVAAHGVVAALFAALFLRRGYRRRLHTWRSRALDPQLLKLLIRFGVPRGVGWAVEMTAWTAFLFIVGRLGTVELAATNIAWRINGFAFFPIVGMAQAVGILVGNAQGAGNSKLAVTVTWRGLLLAEVWMVISALIFLVFPDTLYALFRGDEPIHGEQFAAIAQTGSLLLRFVAAYSLLDALNIIFLSSLQSAGDTRFTMFAAACAHGLFLAALVLGLHLEIGIMGEWMLATVFVMVQGIMWMGRFLAGRWKNIRVVEAAAAL